MLARRWFVAVLATVTMIAGCQSGVSGSASPSQNWGPDSYDNYQESYADWAAKYVVCAREFGAAAILHPDGTITDAVAEGRPTKELLDADCIAEVGSPPEAPGLTPEFLSGLYVLFVEEAKCLREHGYTISEAPSQEDWVENYGAASWDPLVDVDHAGLDVSAADAKCPQPDRALAWRIGYSQP
ncbi:hypothetical protein [Demequina sp.]|uniref:hypothetical protein n=1 Tax=Demequina sp. TaxID=2050685 RepID=UPI003D10D92B